MDGSLPISPAPSGMNLLLISRYSIVSELDHEKEESSSGTCATKEAKGESRSTIEAWRLGAGRFSSSSEHPHRTPTIEMNSMQVLYFMACTLSQYLQCSLHFLVRFIHHAVVSFLDPQLLSNRTFDEFRNNASASCQ